MYKMEKVIIQSYNKNQAKKVRRLATILGCNVHSTELPDNMKEGIKQRFNCPMGVSDTLIELIQEPGIVEEAMPDKVKTAVTEHIIKKSRRF